MGVLDKVVGALSSVGSKVATAPTGEAAGLKAKKDNIDDYMKSVSGEKPEVKATPVNQDVDKLHPKAKFGDQPGEKRIDTSSYKKGTTSVPKTGLAKVHKGEAIIPAKENPMNKSGSGMDAVMSLAKDKAPKKEIKTMEHSKSHNGKHIVVHRHHSPAHHPDETHVLNSMDELHAHMDGHAADDPSGDQPQMTAAPSPMPATAAGPTA